jgi:hypothetical protein
MEGNNLGGTYMGRLILQESGSPFSGKLASGLAERFFIGRRDGARIRAVCVVQWRPRYE